MFIFIYILRVPDSEEGRTMTHQQFQIMIVKLLSEYIEMSNTKISNQKK